MDAESATRQWWMPMGHIIRSGRGIGAELARDGQPLFGDGAEGRVGNSLPNVAVSLDCPPVAVH